MLIFHFPVTNAKDVGIYISNNLYFEKISNARLLDSESLWIKVKFPNYNISHVNGTNLSSPY